MENASPGGVVGRTSTCVICLQSLSQRNDSSQSRNYSDSLCSLLDLDLAEFLLFFENAAYCQPCQGLLQEVEAMVSELARLKEKMSKARQELSALLLTSFENWFREQDQEEEEEIIEPAVVPSPRPTNSILSNGHDHESSKY